MKPSSKLSLSENPAAIKEIDGLLFACANSQKLYGREPEAFKATITIIHKILGRFPADKAVMALQTWLERSNEYPTPADIVGLIRRNGKPPIRESDIIAIHKKEVRDWTRAEGELVEEWNRQQREEWASDCHNDAAEEALRAENVRLRKQVKELEDEVKRAWAAARLLHHEPPAPITMQEKIDNTINAMRERGASQDQIDEFLESVVV